MIERLPALRRPRGAGTGHQWRHEKKVLSHFYAASHGRVFYSQEPRRRLKLWEDPGILSSSA